MPKVSVIIPCYNVEKYISECLDSVLNQTLKDIEIICVEDYSTDKTKDIIKKYSKKDKRVHLIELKQNSGAAIARNQGLDVAKGEYIAFMDSDDFYFDEDVLSDLYNAAKCKNVNICGGGLVYFKENKIIPAEQSYSFKTDTKIQYVDYQFDYGFTRFIYNKRFLDVNHIRFPNYLTQEDPVFFVKAMFKAKEFFALKRISYCYRITEKEHFCTFKQTKDCFKSLLLLLNFCKKHRLHNLYVLLCSRLSSLWFAEKSKLLIDSKGRTDKILGDLLKSFDYKIIYSLNPCFKLPKLYEQMVPDLYKISVIIPVYNVEKYLKKCVKSVISQTYPTLEIILVDDGSPDTCPKICDDFAKTDARVKVIHKKNGGLSSARNAGLDVATGQYVYFLDSDDYIEKETLETMLKTMQDNNVDIVVAGVQPFYTGKTKPKLFDTMVKYFDICQGNLILKAKKILKLPAVSVEKLYKKSIIDKYNLRFDEGLINEDEGFNWYYNTKIKSGIFIPNKFYNYLIRQDSIMGKKQNNGDKMIDVLFILDNIYNHLIYHNLYRKYKKMFRKYANDVIRGVRYFAGDFHNQYVIEECNKRFIKYNNFIERIFFDGEYKFIERIFSIKNSQNGEYKIICVFGIKIKFKR